MAIKRYRYRAYPTGRQVRMLARTFGSCRVVFNDFIAERNRLYRAGLHKEVSFAETTQLVTTLAKRTPERAWLSEVSAVPLQQSAADATRAYRNFFDSLAGKRKGRKMGLPSRKRRSHRQSARFTANAGFRVLDTTGSKWGKVRLPKIGDLRFLRSRDLPTTPTSVTVILEPDGTYWVSFVVDEPAHKTAPAVKVVAIDLGLADLATVVSINPSAGEATRQKIANPKHFRACQRRLARQQRSLSRKQKGSTNRAKARIRVARTHRKVRDLRADHHHKLAHRLVADHDVLVLETLSLAGMGRTRLAKSVHDAGLGNLIRLLTEKAENQGRTVVRIGQWEPTTQTCSVCGYPGGKKPLAIREWICGGCESRLDRDYNAAVNILVAAGLAETLNACGPGVRRTLACAVGDEAGTHRSEVPHHGPAVGIPVL